MIPPGQADSTQPVPNDAPGTPFLRASQPGSARILALIEVIFCSGFPTQLTLAVVLTSVGLTSLDQAGQLSLSYVVALSLADAAVLIGLIFYFIRRHGENPSEVFLGTRSRLAELKLGLLLIPLMVGLAVASLSFLHYFWPWLRNVPENPMEALIRSPIDALLFIVVAVVAGGLREELQRVFILRRFEQHLGGGWLGLLVFSVMFGLGHYIQGWDAAIVTAMLGATWGAIYLVRRSIVSSMVSHAGFNLAEILIALAAPASL